MRSSLWRSLAALAAVLVLGGSGSRVCGATPPAPVPVDPAITLADWRVAAVPVLAGARPGLARVPAEAAGDDGTEPPARPAVCLQLHFYLDHAGGRGTRTPLAAAFDGLRIRRAPAGSAAWRQVADASMTACAEVFLNPLEKRLAPTTVKSGEAYWVDAGVEPGRRYDYQVQLLRGGKVWAESGVCTGGAIALPEAECRPGAEGCLEVRWGAPPATGQIKVDNPRLWVRFGYDAACRPWAAGACALPVPPDEADWHAVTLRLTGRLHDAAWSLRDGRTEDGRAFRLTRTVRPAVKQRDPRVPAAVTPEPPPEWAGLCWQSSFGDRGDVPPLQDVEGFAALRTLDQHFWFDGKGAGSWQGWQVAWPNQLLAARPFAGPGMTVPMLPPGRAERVAFQVGAKAGTAAPAGTPYRFSLLRAPVSGRLRAVCGDGWVRLSWAALEGVKADDWLDGPRFVLCRVDQADMARDTTTPTPDNWGRLREVYAGGPEVLEYTDRGVRNGTAYYYLLFTEGVARATGWHREHGAFDLPQPVRVPAPFGWSGRPLVAVPEAPHPLRVGFLPGAKDADGAPATAALRDAFLNELTRRPWVAAVERTGADKLFAEQQLTQVAGAAADTPAAGGPATADFFLEWRQRSCQNATWFDIWLADHRQGIHERLWSGPAATFDPATAVGEVAKQLAAFYPVVAAAARPVAAATPAPAAAARRLRIAVGELATGANAEAAGKLDDLLALALTERREFEVVDRRETARVLGELGTATADPLQLGRLLKADRIVTGSCTEAGGRLRVDLRLLDPVSGAVVATQTEAAPAAELDTLCTRLAGRLAAAGGGAGLPATASNAVLRLLEADLLKGVTPPPGRRLPGALQQREAGDKKAAFLTADRPEHYLSLAEGKAREGAVDEAAGYYRQALQVAPPAQAATVCRRLARYLIAAGRPAAAESILGTTAAKLGDLPADQAALTILRGEALHLLGRDPEALALAREVGKGPAGASRARELALLFEQLKAWDEAAACWLKSCGRPALNFYANPAYLDLVQRLDRPEYAAHRAELLAALAEHCLRQHRGWQALKCAEAAGADAPAFPAARRQDVRRRAVEMLGLTGRPPASPAAAGQRPGAPPLPAGVAGGPPAPAPAPVPAATPTVPPPAGDAVPELAGATPALAAAYQRFRAAAGRRDMEEVKQVLTEISQQFANPAREEDRRLMFRLGRDMTTLANTGSLSPTPPPAQTLAARPGPPVLPGRPATLPMPPRPGPGQPPPGFAGAPPGPSAPPAPLRVQGGRLVGITAEGVLTATDERSGKTLWTAPLPPLGPAGRDAGPSPLMMRISELDLFNALLVAWQDLILVPDAFSGAVLAFDAATGQLRWQHLEWFPVSNLQADGDGIRLATATGDLVLLDGAGRVVGRRANPAPVLPPARSPVPPMLSQMVFEGRPGSAIHTLDQAQYAGSRPRPPGLPAPAAPPPRFECPAAPDFFWPQEPAAALVVAPKLLPGKPAARLAGSAQPAPAAAPPVAAESPEIERLLKIMRQPAGFEVKSVEDRLQLLKLLDKRANAMLKLFRGAPPAGIDQLRPELDRMVTDLAVSRGSDRATAIQLLAKFWGAPAVAGEIAPALDDPEMNVVIEAARQLALSGQSRYAERFAVFATMTGEARWRMENAGVPPEQLGAYDPQEHQYLEQRAGELRPVGVHGVVLLGGPDLIRRALAPVLAAPDSAPEKPEAVLWLTLLGDPAAAARLPDFFPFDKVKDVTDDSARLLQLAALARTGNPAANQELDRLVKQRNLAALAAIFRYLPARDALARLQPGGPAPAGILRNSVVMAGADPRSAAVLDAIAANGDPALVPLLADQLQQENASSIMALWQDRADWRWCYARSGSFAPTPVLRGLQDLTGRDFGGDTAAWHAWTAAPPATGKPPK